MADGAGVGRGELPKVSDRQGQRSRVYREEIPVARIADFYRAIGVEPRAEAPPSFMTVCRKGEFELFETLGIPLDRVLHADQEYTFDEPIRGGDTVEYSTELVTALEKRSAKGQMLFLSVESTVEIDRGGQRLRAGSARSTVVVK